MNIINRPLHNNNYLVNIICYLKVPPYYTYNQRNVFSIRYQIIKIGFNIANYTTSAQDRDDNNSKLHKEKHYVKWAIFVHNVFSFMLFIYFVVGGGGGG